ncbi:MAG: NAD(+)/NADH kinase [Planctomycetaceae bacterium]|jgi:NAD+ kinase|nr:NAD(+)/NADH kinase [Planctomycetaceae bacterium]
MKFILLGNGTRKGVLETAAVLRPELERIGQIAAADFYGKENVSQTEADLAIVFGGDGSILRAVAQLGQNQIPVLAVHLGTLSFLSTIQVDELISFLKDLSCRSASGRTELPAVEHLLLAAELAGVTPCRLTYLVVNEIYLQSNSSSRLTAIDLFIDGERITTYRCDGLILSTPVGSTGHNLSAGGPILRKDIDAVVISPVSPHTLSNRPLVESPDRTFELKTHQSAVLIIDGVEIAEVKPEDTVRITRAAQTFKLLDVPGYSYYRTLRNKLNWNGG